MPAPSFPRARLALLVLTLFSAAACRQTRAANGLIAGGVRILASSDGTPEESLDQEELGTAAQAVVMLDAYDVDDDELLGRAHLQAAIGGNADGLAGLGELAVGVGPALEVAEEHYIGGRLGLDAHGESNPYNGWSSLELPTAELGYVYRADDGFPWHVELMGDGAFHLAGAATSDDRLRDYFVRPTLGGRMVAYGELITFEARYAYLFDENDLHVVQGRACLALLFATCADLRSVNTVFEGERRNPVAIGITIGLGLASGYDYSARW